MSSYKYDPGQGRTKHKWNRDEAGFKPSKRGAVGKCPKILKDDEREALLNDGVPFFDFEEDEHPSRIYNVHNGVIYEAQPTEYGKSYHGYPWQGDLPKRILHILEIRAEKAGCLKELKKWLKEHLSNKK